MIRSVYYIEHPELGEIERPIDSPRPVGTKFKFSSKELNEMFPEPDPRKELFKNNTFIVEKMEPWSDKGFQNGRNLDYYYLVIAE